MNEDRWREAWNVFEAACERTAGERLAFAENALSDPGMLQKVLTLLERQEAADEAAADGGSFLYTQHDTIRHEIIL